MVHLKGIFVMLPFLFLTIAVLLQAAESNRIAYKKPIYGKSNHLKEKRSRSKTPMAKTTNASVPLATTLAIDDDSTTAKVIVINAAPTTEQQQIEATTSVALQNLDSITQLPLTKLFITTTTTNVPELPVPSNLPVPCTCGVFMGSQIKRLSREPPAGLPVVMHELDRQFPCNAVGQKQCQTKCLETLVQYLPNSANILCASLDRDCRKERAYLFLKNCRNQWVNTNLTAGREYCCSNGKPYPCPLI